MVEFQCVLEMESVEIKSVLEMKSVGGISMCTRVMILFSGISMCTRNNIS